MIDIKFNHQRNYYISFKHDILILATNVCALIRQLGVNYPWSNLPLILSKDQISHKKLTQFITL